MRHFSLLFRVSTGTFFLLFGVLLVKGMVYAQGAPPDDQECASLGTEQWWCCDSQKESCGNTTNSFGDCCRNINNGRLKVYDTKIHPNGDIDYFCQCTVDALWVTDQLQDAKNICENICRSQQSSSFSSSDSSLSDSSSSSSDSSSSSSSDSSSSSSSSLSSSSSSSYSSSSSESSSASFS